MADQNTPESNLSSKRVKGGPSIATSRAGFCCKRKIYYAENDDLLSIIFGEREHESEGQEDVLNLGPVIPKKKAKRQWKGAIIPLSTKKSEKAMQEIRSKGGGYCLKKIPFKNNRENPKEKEKEMAFKSKIFCHGKKLRKISFKAAIGITESQQGK